MLIAAKAMKKGVEVLKPHLASGAAGALGKVIIGTVAGDLHDIGKNLVAMMIESAGFEVIDLGVDVPVEKFLSAYEENEGVKIIACSALLTTTMPALEETVTALNAAPWRGNVKVMVGGAPITQEFADKIGADHGEEHGPGPVGESREQSGKILSAAGDETDAGVQAGDDEDGRQDHAACGAEQRSGRAAEDLGAIFRGGIAVGGADIGQSAVDR